MKRLRVGSLMIQVGLVWDDGDEITAGPVVEPVSMPVSKVADFIENLPGHVAELEKQAVATQEPQPNRAQRRTAAKPKGTTR